MSKSDDGSRPSQSTQARAMTVAEWITPHGNGPSAASARRRGHHRLQVALDIVGYAHNIPVRLLLPDRLRDLPEVVRGLLKEQHIVEVLRSDAKGLGESAYPMLASPEQLALATDWILKLQHAMVPPPEALVPGWLEGAIALLPYIERKVWLTEMGNTLPAHALCRMQDHWALFVLLWTWRHAQQMSTPWSIVEDTLDVAGLEGRTLEPFKVHRPDGILQTCIPVVGPYFVTRDGSDRGRAARYEAFCDQFYRFVHNVMPIDKDRDGHSYTVPLRDELLDALNTRIALTSAEAGLRARTASYSLTLLLQTSIPDPGFANAMTRKDWEILAALCSWLARWDDALIPHMSPERSTFLRHDADAPGILARLVACGTGPSDAPATLSLSLVDCAAAPGESEPADVLLARVDAANRRASRNSDGDAFRIDRPERYFGRIRERQNSMWSSQVIAINNLLNRHGPRDVYIGADEFAPDADGERGTVKPGDAEHLLRGFGGRICRYLVSMTRADAAAIYWLDHAQAPPRLLPAGHYARLAAHRASGHAIWEKFDLWAWAPGPELGNRCQANRRGDSVSQAYRVAETGIEDPPPLDGMDSGDSEAPTQRKKVVPATDEASVGADAVPAYFDCYPEPRPVDSMAAPLLVNGRVIGVVRLLGLVERQFEPRLFWPLRRAAGMTAACINHQCQVWHMRRLNYLFARRGLHEFQRRVQADHAHSPLRDVSRCLANIFLCPAAHIWLQTSANENRLELVGHNWDDLFRFPGASPNLAREMLYRTESTHRADGTEASFRPFSSMALDLARTRDPTFNPLGKFVQGFFDESTDKTIDYDWRSASTVGVRLGKDFYSAGYHGDEVAAMKSRERIFGREEVGGYRLLDIMSFALMSPVDGGWKTEGVVTLHDRGDARRDALRQCQPWDRGWSPVVAHMQTFLPYLFKQAEVLNDPEVSARRYLIHAGRAELIAVHDNMVRLRQKLETALAPGRGVRQMLDKVMSPGFSADHRDELRNAHAIVSEAWEALQLAASPNWERDLRQLTNVMHEYRQISALPGVALTAANERIRLQQLMEEIIVRFAHEFRHRRSKRVNIPESLELSLPGQWLRIVLRDLVHNAAKYATGDSFDVSWEQASHTLVLVNEGPYQSHLDQPQRLLAAGGRGSASLAGRDSARERVRLGDSRGHGLGLWGAKLLCDVMDIGFSIDPKPMSATIKTRADGVQVGTARYIVRLAFPSDAIVSSNAAATSGYY